MKSENAGRVLWLSTLMIFAIMLAAILAKAQTFPDHELTPGATDPSVTRDQLCTPGYTAKVRNVSEKTKKEVFERYRFRKGKYKPGDYEIDHFISLELGGSNDVTNLWPEPYSGKWGARKKDVVETWLHRELCKGHISLEEAQTIIKTDWTHTYNEIQKKKKAKK